MEKPSKREIEQTWLDSHTELLNINEERLRKTGELNSWTEPEVQLPEESVYKRNWKFLSFLLVVLAIEIGTLIWNVVKK